MQKVYGVNWRKITKATIEHKHFINARNYTRICSYKQFVNSGIKRYNLHTGTNEFLGGANMFVPNPYERKYRNMKEVKVNKSKEEDMLNLMFIDFYMRTELKKPLV